MTTTHIFTSCTNNYLPLTRVLAQSLKKFHPDFCFHLVLCDRILDSFNIAEEDFDHLITIDSLEIPDVQRWLFKHSVVELCTAVKGLAAKYIINNYKCDQIIFFDPDIAIFSPLDELLSNFEDSNILITPHQLQPETISSAIVDNEISFLRHGTFNLGFLGVRNSAEGIRFLDWWANRCLHYCYADSSYGLYTDQRWMDLVPSFFEGVNILKHPGYNVANWNLSNRDVQGNLDNQILVNGEPLCFYHFSASQLIMLEKYNLHNMTTLALEKWYKQKCQEMGQEKLGKLSCVYNYFENGNLIPQELRELYRQVEQLQQDYPHPFADKFDQWFQSHKVYLEQQTIEYALNELEITQKQLITAQQDLMQTKDNVNSIQEQLINTQQDLMQTNEYAQNKLKVTQEELVTTQKQLITAQQLVLAMESSKFWKLRQKWFKVKGELASAKNMIKRSLLLPQKIKVKEGLASAGNSIKRSLLWLPPKILAHAKTIKTSFHKLLITPQYEAKPLEIPQSYYQQNKKNLINPPPISIITPSYNQAHFIEDTIKSVLEQNYPKLEYIVQDGQSTDNTAQVVEKYDQHLQFYSEADKGQGNAINMGFQKATGKIMAWLNSDDLLLPGTLSYVAEYFQKNPQVDVIYGHRIIINENNLETGRWVLPPHDDKMLQWADYVPQETMFWRRELWEKAGGYIDESFQFAIDWDLILRFRKAGATFSRVPRFLGAFRVHLQQKTQSWNAVGEEEMNILRRQCHGYIPTSLDVNHNIRSYLIRSLYHYQLHSINKVIAKRLGKNYAKNY